MSLLHSAVEDGELAIVVGRSPKGAQLLHLTSRQTLAVPGLQDVPTGAWVELRTGHTPVQITDLLQTQLYTGLENPEFSRIEVRTVGLCVAPKDEIARELGDEQLGNYLLSPLLGKVALAVDDEMEPGQFYDVWAVYAPAETSFFRWMAQQSVNFYVRRESLAKVTDFLSHPFLSVADYVDMFVVAVADGVLRAVDIQDKVVALVYTDLAHKVNDKIKVLLFCGPVACGKLLFVGRELELDKETNFGVTEGIPLDFYSLPADLPDPATPESSEMRTVNEKMSKLGVNLVDFIGTPRSSSTSPSKESFEVVTKKKKAHPTSVPTGVQLPEPVTTFDQVRNHEELTVLVVNVSSAGVFGYHPRLPREILLSEEDGLKVCDWVKARLMNIYSNHPSAQVLQKLSKVPSKVVAKPTKNTCVVVCTIRLPDTYDGAKNMLVTSDYIPIAIAPNLSRKDVPAEGRRAEIIRTRKHTYLDKYPTVYWIVTKI